MTTRSCLPCLIVALALTTAACMTPTGPRSTYTAELDRLTADCAERGGILSPLGATTGRPATDYVCEIRGASRIRD